MEVEVSLSPFNPRLQLSSSCLQLGIPLSSQMSFGFRFENTFRIDGCIHQSGDLSSSWIARLPLQQGLLQWLQSGEGTWEIQRKYTEIFYGASAGD